MLCVPKHEHESNFIKQTQSTFCQHIPYRSSGSYLISQSVCEHIHIYIYTSKGEDYDQKNKG